MPNFVNIVVLANCGGKAAGIWWGSLWRQLQQPSSLLPKPLSLRRQLQQPLSSLRRRQLQQPLSSLRRQLQQQPLSSLRRQLQQAVSLRCQLQPLFEVHEVAAGGAIATRCTTASTKLRSSAVEACRLVKFMICIILLRLHGG